MLHCASSHGWPILCLCSDPTLQPHCMRGVQVAQAAMPERGHCLNACCRIYILCHSCLSAACVCMQDAGDAQPHREMQQHVNNSLVPAFHAVPQRPAVPTQPPQQAFWYTMAENPRDKSGYNLVESWWVCMQDAGDAQPHREMQQHVNNPLVPAFHAGPKRHAVPAVPERHAVPTAQPRLLLAQALPQNVHLLTLSLLPEDRILLRLAHLYTVSLAMSLCVVYRPVLNHSISCALPVSPCPRTCICSR